MLQFSHHLATPRRSAFLHDAERIYVKTCKREYNTKQVVLKKHELCLYLCQVHLHVVGLELVHCCLYQ